jgi:hypothetical protein
MAISVTDILGTDSLSGSRLVINDNFNILASEINAMEVYFNPSSGTLNNLNDVKTESLRVGLSTVLLDINATTFNILTNVSMSGNLNLNGSGMFRNDVDPQTLNDTYSGPSLTISVGTSSAIPPYTIERVANTNVAPLSILLNDGAIGQEIIFTYSEVQAGLVQITGAINPLILPVSQTTVTLGGKGESVHFLCVDDGTGNGEWYIIGGVGFVLS